MWLWIVLGALVLAAVIARLYRGQPRLMPEAQCLVEIDDVGISCKYPGGEEPRISWDELAAVNIRTNDSGPWGTDVFWGFHGRDGKAKLVIPGGATGEGEMLEALQRLPGFDDAAVIKAMGCTSNNWFECWRRQNP